MPTTIGIIGGSGLYDMAELTDRRDVTVDTPFGPPSAPLVTGTLVGQGRGVPRPARHRAPADAVRAATFRANIYAMKTLGVERILSASAVGSLKEEYVPLAPGHPRPVLRSHQGAHQHVLRRRPGRARRLRASVLRRAVGDHLRRGGRAPAPPCTRAAPTSAWKGRSSRPRPSRSSIAQWGMDIIGMTNLQEAKLAREAEICYTTIALVTDYDCWHPDARFGDGRDDHRQPDAERPHRAEGDRRRGRRARRRAAHLPVRDRAGHRHHHAARARAGRAPRRELAPIVGKYLVNEDRRHRFDRLRLPDVVSRARSPSTCCPSTCRGSASASSSTRWTSGAAAARRTSPTRWRCSASGRCLMATAGQDFGDYRAWLEAAGVDTSLVKEVDGQVHRVVLLQHRSAQQPDRVVLHRRDGQRRRAVVPHRRRGASWRSSRRTIRRR